jgi:hypothetical protein
MTKKEPEQTSQDPEEAEPESRKTDERSSLDRLADFTRRIVQVPKGSVSNAGTDSGRRAKA